MRGSKPYIHAYIGVFVAMVILMASSEISYAKLKAEIENASAQVLGSNSDTPGKSADAPGKTKDTDDVSSPGKRSSTQAQQKNLVVTGESDDEGSVLDVSPGKSGKLKVKLTGTNIASDSGIEDGDEVDGVEIEEGDDDTTIRLRGKDNASYVIRKKVAAKTNFPLQVNLETNELIVTTPKGTKVVTVLPDKAVENMLAANVLDQLGGKGGLLWLSNQATDSGQIDDDSSATDSGELDDNPEATDSGELDNDSDASGSGTPVDNEPEIVDEAETVIDLETSDDGTLAYRIKGKKLKKLFGLIDIELDREVLVSAETGELLDIIQDFRTNVLDFLSTN